MNKKDEEMKFKVSDIKPNPFRNIDSYPINREKVEELKRSMDRTDYWGNILGRLVDGVPEIAYGHHRRVALLEKFGPNHMVDIIIRDLRDDDMIQIMANENMDVWQSRAIVDIETVHAVVRAFADGKIQLAKPEKKASEHALRCAPSFSFISGGALSDCKKIYTAVTLAEFLGWTLGDGQAHRKVYSALSALQYVEEGLLKLSTFNELSTSQMYALIEETRKARNEREAAAKFHQERAQEAKRDAAKAEKEAAKADTEDQKHAAKAEQFRAKERQKHAELEAVTQRELGRKSAVTVANALSRGFKEGTLAVKHAHSAAREVLPSRNDKKPPYIDDYLTKVLSDIGDILAGTRDRRVERIEEILKYSSSISEVDLEDAAKTFHSLAGRAIYYAKQFEEAAHSPEIKQARNAEQLTLKNK